MNAFFRRATLLALGIQLGMPIITLPGGCHFVLLIACIVLLGRQIFSPGVWQLCALAAYTLIVGAFYVEGLDEWKESNSQQMRQVAVMLLAFCAMRRVPVSEMHVFFTFVLLIAVAGVVGEMRGLNMHDVLPAKIAPPESFVDVGFLNDGEQRYRGFFSEASILLATTTSYAFIAVLGALALWRNARRRVFLASSAAAGGLCILFLLAVTLAKTGLLLAFGGGAGYVVAVVRYAPRRRLLGLFGAGAIVAVLLAAGLAALPTAKQEYFMNDLRALRPALEGNSKLEATSSGGLLTRVEGWRIAFVTVRQHPLGVGLFGIGDVYGENNHISLTGELKYLFSLDIYGLKNTLANVLAQSGLPGAALLLGSLWQCFVRPLRSDPRHGELHDHGPAGVYLAALVIAFLFLATCESYYWMAFVIVLKCYADAVMRERTASTADAREEANLEDEPTSAEPAYL
jgi:hypothetical protein